MPPNPATTAPPNAATIRFRDLTVGFDSHAAVHLLNGEDGRGTLTAIVGPNDSGQSTPIKSIVALLKPVSGTCRIAPGVSSAHLPQQSQPNGGCPVSVSDLVAAWLWQWRGLLGRHRPQDRQAIAEALHAVGPDGFDARPTDTLTGGRLQRALFARVLVQDADLIHRRHDEGRTVNVVVHHLDPVRVHFPQALLPARRAIAWGPSARVVTAHNMRRARQFQEGLGLQRPLVRTGASAQARGPADA